MSSSPTPRSRLTDEQIIDAACTAADALDATRVSERRDGGWHATTIFDGEAGLIRFGRLIEKALSASSEKREPTPIGLFWQTADGRWHFSPGSFNRGDIHDNGRPIHLALLGEEAK